MPTRPLIGITPQFNPERGGVWSLDSYVKAVRAAGGMPVILPVDADEAEAAALCGRLDGLLLSGGPDIDPVLLGEEPRTDTLVICPERDAQELPLARLAVAADLPLLCVCRGVQVLNAALGGSLWQDLPSEHPSAILHRQSEPATQTSHTVAVAADTPLRALTGKAVLSVNSLHHQAIREPAPCLQVMATAPDGVVEAVWHPGRRFVWGVQWHPERLCEADPDSRALFRAFVAAAEKTVQAARDRV